MQTRRILLASSMALLANGTALAAPHRHHAGRKTEKSGGDEPEDGAATPAIPSSPATTPLGPVDTLARWACIVDFESGTTLLEKAADDHMPPSSLTKMVTAYIVFTMLKMGRLKLDQTLSVSERAWRMQGSKMFVPLGESIPVQDLIEGMLIQSGNDACIVLAEGISGSEEQFVNTMNEFAAKLGMANSHFLNATGWPAEGHYMSARDTATIATHLIRDFPEYYHFFSETSFKFNKINQGNRNVLVDKGLADGLKTGHTDAGGFGLCASSLRDGRRVVMVLNGMASSNERAHEGERMLGWAFANFETATLVKHGQLLEQAPVWMGEARSVPVLAGRTVSLVLPHGWQSRLHIALDYTSPVAAPVLPGQVLGQLTLSLAGSPDIVVPAIAGGGTARLGLFGRVGRKLGMGQS